ncbi:binding-protein-dependent transport system inner membrane protein [Brachyspira hampsonii 30446]|uniref:Binding-protein-dependent transport system inner membrane protein n=1 Tax=Brachyspira hampsonii 30446 TaxID=1289135 RepID=A0A2U4EWY7_9SPIR|nr:binding-protein-dependent transport system inner membrane protein [Brachyspira hampsonii 30446]MBW5389338.1 ABC transporter permease [Brachyspira hampsonii]MBW5394951.1 ABC transporter permease [Brachyspira hampsonii]
MLASYNIYNLQIDNSVKIIKQNIILVLILILWFIASESHIWSAYVLPSPQRVIRAFYMEIMNGNLIKNTYVSLLRVIIGFSIAFVFAFIFGMILGIKPERFEYFRNIIEFMRNVPPISLIAILILWFGIGEKSKIIIIILASFFPIFINIRQAIGSVDKKLIEVGYSLGFTKSKIFFKIMLPSALPSILAGMKIGLGYSFRAIIGAEMIAASSGLGYMILDAQQLSRSDKVIAGIITIGILGYMFDILFSYLIKKLPYSKGVYIES